MQAAGKSRLHTTLFPIDRKEGDYYVGRTEFSSPEVDPEVLIPLGNKVLRKGAFYDVKITDAEDFDLFGVVQ